MSAIEGRNRVLLWTLAETGCLVSEIGKARFDNFVKEDGGHFLQIDGKAPRKVPVSGALFGAVQKLLEESASRSPWVFLGHNKFGSLGGPISPRGVELLVQSFAQRARFEAMTPRTFRHSAVMHWFRQGLEPDEVQKRLGLKSKYAFRAFQSVIKSAAKSSADSTSNA